jgi:F0F1-type ATP synthase assembly protein I
MSEPTDDRSRQAIAYSWASRIISISLEMVLPGLLGVWLDRKFGTRVLFTVIGFGLGLTLGMTHLLKIARSN